MTTFNNSNECHPPTFVHEGGNPCSRYNSVAKSHNYT